MLSFAVGDGSAVLAGTPGWPANACTNGAADPVGTGVGVPPRVDALVDGGAADGPDTASGHVVSVGRGAGAAAADVGEEFPHTATATQATATAASTPAAIRTRGFLIPREPTARPTARRWCRGRTACTSRAVPGWDCWS